MSTLQDEWEIHKLSAMFADAVNIRDLDLFQSLWTDDAEWVVLDIATAHGAAAIAAKLGELLQRWEWIVQMVHSGIVDVQGDVATARWTTHEMGRRATGVGYDVIGVQVDDLQRTSQGWRIARRQWNWIYKEEPALKGEAFPRTADLLAGVAGPLPSSR
jgi:ketosteroid isomerase-like protein